MWECRQSHPYPLEGKYDFVPYFSEMEGRWQMSLLGQWLPLSMFSFPAAASPWALDEKGDSRGGEHLSVWAWRTGLPASLLWVGVWVQHKPLLFSTAEIVGLFASTAWAHLSWYVCLVCPGATPNAELPEHWLPSCYLGDECQVICSKDLLLNTFWVRKKENFISLHFFPLNTWGMGKGMRDVG